MDWKLTKKAEKMKNKIANGEDFDDSPFGGSDGFWYNITDGGYFKPEEALLDQEQIKKINEAVELLRDLEENVYNQIVPEF